MGTALEWYDFFIYGTAAALVFGDLFFPGDDPAAGTLAAFATFGVGFLFRPLGGIVFGHLGDRIGRRATLIATTLIMGIATGLIGLLPTYDAIGLWAPALLTLLRICQGLGAGAEFGGASTLLAEHAPPGRRGFYCSFAQTGVQIGLVLGTGAFLLVGLMPEGPRESWGWRLPFLAGFAMIAVALYVRLRVAESPVFRRMESTRRVVRMPVLEAVRRHPRGLLIGIGAHIGDTALIYTLATFTVSYATAELGLPGSTVLAGVLIFGVVVIALQPVYGALSDRVGRRPLNIFSVVFAALFWFPYFLLVQTGTPALIHLAMVVMTAFGFAPMVAVQPAFYAELFGARVRYSGFATSRELSTALVGFSPFVAAYLTGLLDGAPWLVAAYLVATALVTLVAFVFSAETKDMDITAIDPGRPETFGAAGSGTAG
ncbi:MHS family shikimate/dehydroshikimate transporter-like MFS transporter [Thermocatellispora tengchongensis]|uniref:Putative proline/betaine transporter n=1 Tax=Thermocatellispora tengchongensis TaxID=1073253 RepID=A0A840P0T0_9ACTN|nr:MFS transporter [Thermocatellispora tengchongensis]MBB5131501.1 MHS family shikimate/dehydroshikimate transporter-like MFS transporter [Thermocatellispora tengchongensis]